MLGSRAIVIWALCLSVVGSTSSLPRTMKAVVATGAGKREGDFSKVAVMDRPVPKPGRGQVLIKVMASSVNPVDWKLLSNPLLSILTAFGPKTLGFDVSGVVQDVGEGCTRLKVGDAVWADLGESSVADPIQLGAWAEYAVADEGQVGLKPARLDFKAAASLPLVAMTDYQALRKVGAPWQGASNLTVVVTSGSGGTGTPAIRMAKAWGATRIITAASASNVALLKQLGATDVFDYRKTTIWNELPENSVDIVYDNFGSAGTADAAMPSLRSGGAFVFLPGKGGDVSKHPKEGVKQVNYGLLDSSHHEDLDALSALADAGNLTAVIQESFSLDDVHLALNVSFSGHVVGKVGIDVEGTGAHAIAAGPPSSNLFV